MTRQYRAVSLLSGGLIITGEVVGQRPDTMPIIAAESGAEELLLRPLSAHNLPPSKPEREGWVNREQLFGFRGRSRKPQMALATQWGITDYAQPAGGRRLLLSHRRALRR